MSTVAYKNGIIACDTKSSTGGTFSGSHTKIARNAKGDLIGCAGETQWAAATLKWFVAGEKGKRPTIPTKQGENPSCGFIVRAAAPEKAIEFYSDGVAPLFEFGHGPSGGYALGSGQDVAYGAMFAGADAITAVKAGVAMDNGSGGEIHAIGFEGSPRVIHP